MELLAYVLIHIILNRLGRKIPYCTFAIVFGLLALLVLPIQSFLSERKSSSLKTNFSIKNTKLFISQCNVQLCL